jgi:hypothetical protein
MQKKAEIMAYRSENAMKTSKKNFDICYFNDSLLNV